MIITKHGDNGTLTISLQGRLDTLSAPEFDAELQALPPGQIALVLDFKELSYLSSAGLRSLVQVQKRINAQNSSLLIRNVNKNVMDVFTTTHLVDVIAIEEAP
jgi:anti-sigma B factor antagonist